MTGQISTSPAAGEDVDQILRQVQAGFDSYVEFAPSEWKPPHAAAEREATAELLNDPETWAMFALAGGGPVGHVSFYPGRERSADRSVPLRSRALIPGLAHLWQLFVLPAWWGRGVAPVLHDLAIAAIAARGYEQGRLFTPSLHARARRFYERRGWSRVEEDWDDGLRLTLCEYRIPISAS